MEEFSYQEIFISNHQNCSIPIYKTIYKEINKYIHKLINKYSRIKDQIKYKEQKFICLDCETTGLDPDEAEILSLSIVNQEGVVLFDEKFKPEKHNSWDSAEAVHGIKPTDVENKPFIKEKLDDIRTILNQYQMIIGYNITFDLRCIAKAFGKEFFFDIVSDFNSVDVMHLCAPIYGEKSDKWGYKWQTLETCAKYYGYKFKAHNSLEDVKATIYCYNKIMEQKLFIDEVE